MNPMVSMSRALFALAALVIVPLAGYAESTFQTGGGGVSGDARLDFRVTIPRMLFLQVGTGTLNAANATVDLIDIAVPAAAVGNGTPVAATAASGDLGNGTVTARVRGNNGAVTLTSTTTGALGNGAGDAISFAQIIASEAALTSATPLAHPVLVDGATTTTTVPATGKIVNRDARWTFSYANAAAVPPGTYGGVNTNNGRVTYTASMP